MHKQKLIVLQFTQNTNKHNKKITKANENHYEKYLRKGEVKEINHQKNLITNFRPLARPQSCL